MRKTVFPVLAAALLLFAATGIGEADTAASTGETGTRIEAFLARRGGLLVKEVYLLGAISGLYSSSGDISAIITYVPGARDVRLKGLLFEIREDQRGEKTCLSYLDIEEIEDLSSGIARLMGLIEERERSESTYTEITYTTRGSLTFGVHAGEAGQEVYMAAGDAQTLTIYLEPKQMGEIKKIVDYGHTLLNMK